MASSGRDSGGDLSDMAVKGTTVPEDSAKPRVIPSVPRPDQVEDKTGGIGAPPDLAGAADNATDIPRGPRDHAANPEVITGIGDQLPSTTQSKHGHYGADNPVSKGDERYEKHHKSGNTFDKFANEGAEVTPAPGEEEDSQEAIRKRKGA